MRLTLVHMVSLLVQCPRLSGSLLTLDLTDCAKKKSVCAVDSVLVLQRVWDMQMLPDDGQCAGFQSHGTCWVYALLGHKPLHTYQLNVRVSFNCKNSPKVFYSEMC